MALYLPFMVFGLVVASAFGYDALIMSSPTERRALVNRAGTVMMLAGLVAAAGFLWLVYITPASLHILRSVSGYILVDVLVFAGSLWGLRWLGCHRGGPGLAIGVLVLLVASQVLYTTGVYRILGTSCQADDRPDEPAPRRPDPLSLDSNPDRFHRRACTLFAQCYLSLRPSASLRLDLEGSFFRSRDSVIYQSEIAPAVVTALLGISHPVYWASQELREYADVDDLVRALNEAGDRVGELLRRTTFIKAGNLLPRPVGPAAAPPELVGLEREADRTRVAYRSAGPFYLNAAVTYDPGWRASVDGQPLTIHRANFDGLVVEVPSGQHVVEFRYFSWSVGLFFLTRLLQLAVAVAATVGMAVHVVGDAKRLTWFAGAGATRPR